MLKTETFKIRDYIIYKKRIGKGAFSNIYKGYKSNASEIIAVKEINLDTINKYKESIKRETKIMRHLNHPNIIKLYDTVIDNYHDNIYLILEYFPKGDLSKFLKKRPLKEKYSQKFIKQLSLGLEYLLENKIIHRDLKPQNILVTNLGDIKITDFGFARYFEDNTILNTICGSPLYMAPEIIKNRKYDFKSDLWSVGIIFYEMLTGNTPFKAKNIFDLINIIEKKIIVIPLDIKISNNCENLLFSLLKKNPYERIGWEEFFNHPWLKEQYIERENMLMEISTMNSFSEMNNLIKNNSESFFLENKSFKNTDKKLITSNIQLSNTNNSNVLQTEFDLSLKFNFNLEVSDNSISYTDSDNDIFYDSFDNSFEQKKASLEQSYIDTTKMSPESIMIRKDLKNNKEFNDFEYVSSNSTIGINIEDKKSTSTSIMEYLSNSFYIFKQSYKYISKFNSL